jgi:hypothetical protein
MKILFVLSAAVIGGLVIAAQNDPKAVQAKEAESPLIGHWAGIIALGRPGPAQITTITINKDGTYHWLDIEISSGKKYVEDNPISYSPDGAELRHSTGWINLKTGEQRVTDADRKLSVKSVTWTVKKDRLHWDMDMGNMGGQAMTYSRVE